MQGFGRFLVRDLALGALTVGLGTLDTRFTDERAPLAIAVGTATGVMLAICGFLAHEWGHLAATFAAGGVAHPPASLLAIFLFRFDVGESTRRQFLAMSYGGYAATALAAALLFLWADPARWSGVTALFLSGLGILVTLVLEIPTTIRVARGGTMPSGGVYAGKPANG